MRPYRLVVQPPCLLRFATALLFTLLLSGGLMPASAHAQAPVPDVPTCSWPLETSPDSLLNVAYPDTNAIYWTMPIDTVRWSSMLITGAFPAARFMSLTAYDSRGEAVEGLLDYEIRPDQGSRNPFDRGQASAVPGRGSTYTVVVDQAAKAPKGGNHLRLSGDRIGFVIYRLYVPDNGTYPQGGVDLPSITLYGTNGQVLPLQPCTRRDPGSLAGNGYAEAAGVLAQILANLKPGVGASSSCAPDQVAFAIPQSTGGYFPNPANKYIAAPDLCYQPGRVVVVRGKAGVYPDTYNGAPVWQPPGRYAKIDLRYWSMCNNDQTQPYPVVQCAADYQTKVDNQGYYTYVLGVEDQQPDWLGADATWLPWGAQNVPNILIFRNMLPAPSFKQSVQAAISAGCTFDNSTTPVDYTKIAAAGSCAAGVMGAYYPTAVYCDQAILQTEGWQGCFQAANVTPP